MSAQPGRVERSASEDSAEVGVTVMHDRAIPVSVRSLRLTGFRNYARQTLELDGRPIVLFGENGAGKTNLMEAVSLLAPGRGLRRAKTADLARKASAEPSNLAPFGWGVAATVSTAVGPVEIGTGNDGGSDRRVVRINGAASTQTSLSEYVSAVWLTPQMSQLFLEGSSARRRFLDRLVYGFDPAHAGRVTAYEKALRDRTKVLKDGADKGAMDAGWLDALEAQIAEKSEVPEVPHEEIRSLRERNEVLHGSLRHPSVEVQHKRLHLRCPHRKTRRKNKKRNSREEAHSPEPRAVFKIFRMKGAKT